MTIMQMMTMQMMTMQMTMIMLMAMMNTKATATLKLKRPLPILPDVQQTPWSQSSISKRENTLLSSTGKARNISQ